MKALRPDIEGGYQQVFKQHAIDIPALNTVEKGLQRHKGIPMVHVLNTVHMFPTDRQNAVMHWQIISAGRDQRKSRWVR